MATRDDAETVKWYEKGAEQGNVFAQFNLGMAYLKGTGVDRNYIEAYKWLHLSAIRGYDDAPAICGALQKKITSEDVARAEFLAKQWKDDFEKKMSRKA